MLLKAVQQCNIVIKVKAMQEFFEDINFAALQHEKIYLVYFRAKDSVDLLKL